MDSNIVDGARYNNQFIVRQLLNESQICEIKNFLEIANQNNLWRNGVFSGGGDERRKKNLELWDQNISNEIYRIIMSQLDQDLSFFNLVVPDKTKLNIVSKTPSGGYYRPHIDCWFNGEYSTTVFLNEPDEYEGGELCLLINGEEKLFKLKAGSAITYTTGTVHRVNIVTKGVRYASVFWTKSLIKDPFIRYICGDLKLVQETLEKNQLNLGYKFKTKTQNLSGGGGDVSNNKYYSNCLSSYEDPKFIIDNLIENILRRYAS
jgi:PKHD-type hydroxylase